MYGNDHNDYNDNGVKRDVRSDLEKKWIIGPDGRWEILNTWIFPYNTVGQVGSGCTGTYNFLFCRNINLNTLIRNSHWSVSCTHRRPLCSFWRFIWKLVQQSQFHLRPTSRHQRQIIFQSSFQMGTRLVCERLDGA